MAKYKRWRALLHRVITKQQVKKEQTHPVCLHAVQKSEHWESVNTQNHYKTMSKKWTDKKNTLALCVLCMCSNYKKISSRSFKRISR